jgi:WD40 repeat protein
VTRRSLVPLGLLLAALVLGVVTQAQAINPPPPKGPLFTAIAFTPDGQHALTGGRGGVFFWDLAAGKCSGPWTQTKRERDDWRRFSLDVSADGKWALSVEEHDGPVRIWEMATGREVRTLGGHERRSGATTACFSPDGRLIASGGDDDVVRLWDWSSGKEIAALVGHGNAVSALAFSPDGRYLLSGGRDWLLIIWDVSGGRAVRKIETWPGVQAVAFAPTGRFFYSAQGLVRLWEVATGKEARVVGWYCPGAQACSPDGRLVASVKDGELWIWDVTRDKRVAPIGKTGVSPYALAISPDGKRLLYGDERSETLRLWDLSQQKEIGPVK